MNARILTALGLLFLMSPAVPDDRDFTEDEIESEEALANSDAALAEKSELKNLRESEKKRANEEKAQAAKAKQEATAVQNQANKENDKLMKDVKFWQGQRKGFENDRKKSEKLEADQRHQIEKIKIEREKEQAIFDDSKKAKEDAKASYRASVELYKSLKSDLEKMRKDRQKLALVTKDLETKTADVKKRNQVLEQRIHAATKVPVVANAASPWGTAARPNSKNTSWVSQRSVANVANSGTAKKQSTKLGEEKRLKQDCNLRLGPSSKAEVYKILRKGEPVLLRRTEGLWFAVGTKEIEKAYLSKPCL